MIDMPGGAYDVIAGRATHFVWSNISRAKIAQQDNCIN